MAAPTAGEVRMHEVGIAIEIYRMCRARVEERGGGRLERVSVAVGELAAVAPDLLAMAWGAVIANGPDAGAELVVEWRPARLVCPRCGDCERAPSTWTSTCPRCGGLVRVEGGQALDLLQFEFSAAAAQVRATP